MAVRPLELNFSRLRARLYLILVPNFFAKILGSLSFPPKILPSTVSSLNAEALALAKTIYKADILEGTVVDSVALVYV